MLRTSRLFLFLFLFIFIVVTVSAQQPPPAAQTNINVGIGLEVEFTKINILENGADHLFNAHVFNISDQLRVDNTTTNCSFHLFNDLGIAILDQQPMIFDDVGLDWEFNVLGGNFTTNGAYSYLIFCASDGFGGFVSVPIEVTPDGNSTQLFPYQFALIFFSFLLIFSSYFNERLNLFRYVGSIMSMVLGVITLYPGYSFVSWMNIQGQILGFSLIGLGFYFLIEDSFSRKEQAPRFDQDHSSKEGKVKEKKLFRGDEEDD